MSNATWQEQLQKRFDYNIARVKNLIEASEQVQGKNCKGDVLRAAVVLLHATTEDVLRTCQFRRLLSIKNSDALNIIPVGYKDNGSPIMVFTLGQIRHRLEGKDVAKFIERRIRVYFSRQSYNNVDDLEKAAKAIGVESDKARRFADPLVDLMDRRHKIVHQADREPLALETHGTPSDIVADEIQRWIDAVSPFIAAVMSKATGIKERDSD